MIYNRFSIYLSIIFFSKSRLFCAIYSEFFPNHKTFFILQVLSRTTASGLESQGRHDTSGTVKFHRIIDRVFDCLNVTYFNQNTKGKPECKEYRDVNDWRFKYWFILCWLFVMYPGMLLDFYHTLTKAICSLKKNLSHSLVAAG